MDYCQKWTLRDSVSAVRITEPYLTVPASFCLLHLFSVSDAQSSIYFSDQWKPPETNTSYGGEITVFNGSSPKHYLAFYSDFSSGKGHYVYKKALFSAPKVVFIISNVYRRTFSLKCGGKI